MAEQNKKTVKEQIFYSYANLAMAHSAMTNNQSSYGRTNYMIRTKLFNGLMNGTMTMRSMFDDEKIKLQTGQICNYCGSTENLTIDHLFAQKQGGKDDAENLIVACKTCNSSKGKKDLMEWANSKQKFLPLLVIRRYLKLVHNYCVEHDLMEKSVAELMKMELPFRIELLPVKFPSPMELKLI